MLSLPVVHHGLGLGHLVGLGLGRPVPGLRYGARPLGQPFGAALVRSSIGLYVFGVTLLRYEIDLSPFVAASSAPRSVRCYVSTGPVWWSLTPLLWVSVSMVVGSLLRWVMNPADRGIPSPVADHGRPIALRPDGVAPPAGEEEHARGVPLLRWLTCAVSVVPTWTALGPPEGEGWSPFFPCLNRRNLWEG